MISEKILPLENIFNNVYINPKPDINKLLFENKLFENKTYYIEEIEENLFSRNVHNDNTNKETSDSSALSFTTVTDDFMQDAINEIKEIPNEKFMKLLLCCNQPSSADEEDLDKLIENITLEISEFESKIQSLRVLTIAHFDVIPVDYKDHLTFVTNIEDFIKTHIGIMPDVEVIRNVNLLLEKFKGTNF